MRESRNTQTPEDVKHLYVLYKTSVHIRITQVPENAEQLHNVCQAAGVGYKGEGGAAVAQLLFQKALTKPARKAFTAEEKRDIRERQKDTCPVCTGDLGDPPELDHVVPLASGGADDITNVKYKCHTCHLEKTEQERLAGFTRHNPVASVMSRDLLEHFHLAAKPPQIVCGDVPKGSWGIDVVSCRRQAYALNGHDHPRFNFFDLSLIHI